MTSNKNLSDEEKIIRMPDLDYTPDPKGLGHALFCSMKKFKNKTAQVNGVTGEKENYDTLLSRCVRTAIKMRAEGVTPDDVIAICTFNHFNSCVPYLATLFVGAKASAIDPTLSLPDVTHLLKQITPKLIFVLPEGVDLMEKAVANVKETIKIVVFGSSDKHTTFDEYLQPNADEESFEPSPVKNLRDTVIILFSSGTSGLPKGICINHYAYLCQLKNNLDFGFCQDLYLTFSSLFWVSVVASLGSTIMEGSARLLVPRFSPEVVWNAIEKFRPTYVVAVPFHFQSLYKIWHKGIDTSSVKHITVGGGALIESQMKNIQEMFPTTGIFSGYGQTEMAIGVTIFKPSNPRDVELRKTRPTSCGTGIPGISYKVVDTDTEKLLGPNQPGELCLKTDFHLSGYYKMDLIDFLDKDGWYKTGDFVYYDEEKCFYVVDRLKEFLKFQMWHIPPSLLESILTEHPEVASALVIGIPHEIDENHLMALVVLKNKQSEITPLDIQKYVEERVDERKRLVGGVKFVDAIPITATGKTRRRDIRDMVIRGEL